MRRRTIALTTLALAVQALGPVSPARAADPVTVTFGYTADEQVFDVPQGVTMLQFVLIGGRGGDYVDLGVNPGGLGARVEGVLAVSPGTRLYVEVGGGNGATFNGGGPGLANGGGASDLRTVPRSEPGSLDSRLVVAAGGGGAGLTNSGGAAGQPGGGGSAGGGAGTLSAGGTGGSGNHTTGQAGALGVGGGGHPGGGGGGGGGYFGGGAGGYSEFTEVSADGGGGGGGSSYVGPATSTSVIIDSTGIASVAITYSPDLGVGTVDAVVTMATSAVCLELSTTAIDFGTRQFGEVGASATPGVGITNCGGITESILARGTDATGAGPTTWSLVDTGSCAGGTIGLDDYRLTLVDPNTFGETPLTTTNQSLFTLAGGATANRSAAIDTPCPGSSGAGTVMSMQIVLVATE